MAIMAAHEHSDARGSARVLANAAIKCIDAGSATSQSFDVANNLYRLLEAYRSHGFLGFEYEPRSDRGPEALTLLPSADRHVLDLRDALGMAFTQVYSNESTDNAVESVERVLKAVAVPKPENSVPDEDRKRALLFLHSFVTHLNEAR